MIVYVCSPLAEFTDSDGNRVSMATNRGCAIGYCEQVARLGHFPIAPHVTLTQFLDELDPDDRALGLKLGLDALDACDAIWIFGPHLSRGMMGEIQRAIDVRRKRHFDDRGFDVAWWKDFRCGPGEVDSWVELPAILGASKVTQ